MIGGRSIGENALLYAGIAFAHFQYANIGIDQEEHIKKAEEFLAKAFSLDSELAEAHSVLGYLNQSIYGNAYKAISHFKKAYSTKPEDPEVSILLAWGYILVGRMNDAIVLVDRIEKVDPINPFNQAMKVLCNFFQGNFDQAQKLFMETYKMLPESSMWQFWKSIILLYSDRAKEALDFIYSNVQEPGQDALAQMTIFLKYVLKGDKNKLSSLLTPDFVKAGKNDCQFSWHLGTFYSYIEDIDQSLKWLENAVARGFINYPFLNEHDTLLDNIRGEPRFKKLMERVKHEWENFEV
jgi:lipoprotein NlpI